jgi:hypothetical protein
LDAGWVDPNAVLYLEMNSRHPSLNRVPTIQSKKYLDFLRASVFGIKGRIRVWNKLYTLFVEEKLAYGYLIVEKHIENAVYIYDRNEPL